MNCLFFNCAMKVAVLYITIPTILYMKISMILGTLQIGKLNKNELKCFKDDFKKKPYYI